MEGGDAQILPPQEIVKMPIEREEAMVRIKVNGIVLEAHNITGGGGGVYSPITCWGNLDAGLLRLSTSIRVHEAQMIVEVASVREEAQHANRGRILMQSPP